MMIRALLLEQLYRSITTGVACVDRLNSGNLDLIERIEAREQMTTAWTEIRRVLVELEQESENVPEMAT